MIGGIGLSAGLGGIDLGPGSKYIVPIPWPQGKGQDKTLNPTNESMCVTLWLGNIYWSHWDDLF